MKILYFVNGIGRSETFIYELLSQLSIKHSVNLVSLSEPHYKEGVNFTRINNTLPFNMDNVLRYVFEERGKKLSYLITKKITSRKMSPILRNVDVVYIDYGTIAVLILPLLLQRQIPFVVHFHGYDITSQLNNSLYKNDLKILFAKVSYVIAASNHIKRLLILNGCDVSKIRVVRYGITMPKSFYLQSIIKTIDFIFVGRLTPKKNPIALIHSFHKVIQKYPNLNLHIVGDGYLYKDCIELSIKLKLADNIKFHGAVDHLQAMDLLAKSKIYVQHSVTSSDGDQEGFAISLAEAALLKIPVISTFHNGIPENVIDGETGFLVPEFDYETMGDKMIELITNPYLMKSMGEKGRDHITQLCNAERRITIIEEILKSAIDENK